MRQPLKVMSYRTGFACIIVSINHGHEGRDTRYQDQVPGTISSKKRKQNKNGYVLFFNSLTIHLPAIRLILLLINAFTLELPSEFI